jgi:hypothetical protein
MFHTEYIFLDILLYLILISKLLLIFLKIFHDFLINRNILTQEIYITLFEFSKKFFNISMPILLIILFNPITSKYMIINHHIKLFLFTFGILQLINLFNIKI